VRETAGSGYIRVYEEGSEIVDGRGWGVAKW
jgi:hypothetical protein